MNFQVPQFIETEDRIVGPLTLRQFLYLAAAGGVSFLFFFFLELWLWIPITFILAMISLSFAFLKINGRNLSVIILAALQFYWKPKIYLWQRPAEPEKFPELKEASLPQLATEGIKSRLDSLWEQLKTSKNPLPKREKPVKPSLLDRVKSSKERFEMMRRITGEREMARRVDYR